MRTVHVILMLVILIVATAGVGRIAGHDSLSTGLSGLPAVTGASQPMTAATWPVREAAASRSEIRKPVSRETPSLTPKPADSPTGPNPLNAGQLTRLLDCESGRDYTKDTGNGFYGAAQWVWSTWAAVWHRAGRDDLGAIRPDHASPAVQDVATQRLWSERGRLPWPVCGLKVGT